MMLFNFFSSPSLLEWSLVVRQMYERDFGFAVTVQDEKEKWKTVKTAAEDFSVAGMEIPLNFSSLLDVE